MLNFILIADRLRTTQRQMLIRTYGIDPAIFEDDDDVRAIASNTTPGDPGQTVVLQLPDLVTTDDVWLFFRHYLDNKQRDDLFIDDQWLQARVNERTYGKLSRRRRTLSPYEQWKHDNLLVNLKQVQQTFEMMSNRFYRGWSHQGAIVEGMLVVTFRPLR